MYQLFYVVCKIFSRSKFSAILGKLWRRRKWRKPTNAKCFEDTVFNIKCMRSHCVKVLFSSNLQPLRKGSDRSVLSMNVTETSFKNPPWSAIGKCQKIYSCIYGSSVWNFLSLDL